jgi:hypothetical protein
MRAEAEPALPVELFARTLRRFRCVFIYVGGGTKSLHENSADFIFVLLPLFIFTDGGERARA